MARSSKAAGFGVRCAVSALAMWAAGLGAMQAAAQCLAGSNAMADESWPPQAPAVPVVQARPNPSELKLRQDLLRATWPADLVRLADEYLQHHAQQPWAADALNIRQRAQQTALLLRRDDVHLFRSAFALPSEHSPAVEDLRLAALGDASAALRLARLARNTEGAARQQVGWLQLAALLGSERAAYDLALHFRRQSQPLMASVYETRAIELGHVQAPVLDHHRK